MTFEATGSVTFEIDNLDQIGDDLEAEGRRSLGNVTIDSGGSGGQSGGRARRQTRTLVQSSRDSLSELVDQTELLVDVRDLLDEGGFGGGGSGDGGGLPGGDDGGLPFIGDGIGADDILSALGLRQLFRGGGGLAAKLGRGLGPTIALAIGGILDEQLNLDNVEVGAGTDSQFEGFGPTFVDPLQTTINTMFGLDSGDGGDGFGGPDDQTQLDLALARGRANIRGGDGSGTTDLRNSFSGVSGDAVGRPMVPRSGTTDMRNGFAGVSPGAAALADRTPDPTAGGAVDGPVGRVSIEPEVTVNVNATEDGSMRQEIDRAMAQAKREVLQEIERDGSAPSSGIQGRFQRRF